MSAEPTTESFRPTSGRATGVLALAAVAAVVGLRLVEPVPAPVVAGALLVGALVWAALLRPRVLVSGRRLVLRNMLETVSIRLAAVEELTIRQVLAVRVDGKRYVSPAVGRSLHSTVRSGRPWAGQAGAGAWAPSGADTAGRGPSYVDFVEERIRHHVADDRARRGTARSEVDAHDTDVRRTPAWLEIGLLVVTAAAFVVTLLV